MKKLDITIHCRSHAIARLREKLGVSSEPNQITQSLNKDFNVGFYDTERKRVYVACLGYFGIIEDDRRKGKYFTQTYYKGLPPPDYKANVDIEWFLVE